MQKCRRLCLALLIALAAPVRIGVAQVPGQWIGVWRLDVSASSSTGGMPAASTLTISAAADDALRFEIRDVFDGRAQEPWGFVVGPEGSDVPVSPASFIDSVTTTRRRGRSLGLALKKTGAVVSEMTAEVAEDGGTLTIKSSARAPNGDSVSGTSIYRRQS